MARTVNLRPGAQADLLAIAGFIARRVSPVAAARWQGRIAATIGRLASDAEQWPEADEAADLGIALRCRQFGRDRQVYRILFTYDARTVTVIRVRHAAQDQLTADDL